MPLQCFFSLSTLLYLRVPEKTRLLFRQVGKSLMGTSSRSWERWPRWLGATQVNASSSQVHRPRRFLGGGRKKTPWKRPRFYRGHRLVLNLQDAVIGLAVGHFGSRTRAWCAFLAFRSHHVCSPRELDHDVLNVRNIYFNEMALIFDDFTFSEGLFLRLQVWLSTAFQPAWFKSQFPSRGLDSSFGFGMPISWKVGFKTKWHGIFLCRRFFLLRSGWDYDCRKDGRAVCNNPYTTIVRKPSPQVLHENPVWHM